MNDIPIQIRNPEVVRAIRRLARQTGRPLTEAVAQAVNAELERRNTVSPEEQQRRGRGIREAVNRLHALPIIGSPLTDDDLYDEDGLPR